MLLGVYRSIHNGEREREDLWSKLGDIRALWSLMFVKFLGERRNLKIIDELQLRDRPLAAGPFT